MVRHFEFSDGKSNKFWEISVNGSKTRVRFGRVGTSGQTLTKAFATKEAARLAAEKQVAEKMRSGDVETVVSSQGVSEPAKAKRAAKQPAGATASRAKEIGDALKLLGKSEYTAVREGLARLESLDDRESWSALAEGVLVDTWGDVIVPKGSAIHSRVKLAFREEVALRALSESGRRAEVTTLRLRERHYTDLQGLRGFAMLERLDANMAKSLESLEGIEGLTSLQSIDLWDCKLLRNLNRLERLTKLQEVSLSGCTALTDISSLRGRKSIKRLGLSGCAALTDFAPLSTLTGLERLDVANIPSLTSLTVIGKLHKITYLDLSWTRVADLAGIESLQSLERLRLTDVPALRTLRPLAFLPRLRSLEVTLPDGYSEMEGLEALTGLEDLHLSYSPSLTTLNALRGMQALKILGLHGCTALVDLEGIQGLRKLKELNLTECNKLSLKSLTRLKGATSLELLNLSDVEAVAPAYRKRLRGEDIATFLETL
jgi:predicted DNA-binding WGR domain protein/Leucine-rich repeat (LRR) protein